MAKTIKEHMDESDQVKKLVDEANALLMRARKELETVRDVLTSLHEFQHPKMIMKRTDASYLAREVAECGDRDFTPSHLIGKQIARINSLLGDRPQAPLVPCPEWAGILRGKGEDDEIRCDRP